LGVTTYEREEMNRAERNDDGKRRSNVGFALQILQRRLASSPAAIYRLLERRRKRLEERLREELVLILGDSTKSVLQLGRVLTKDSRKTAAFSAKASRLSWKWW
jgi:hypothetical protein